MTSEGRDARAGDGAADVSHSPAPSCGSGYFEMPALAAGADGAVGTWLMALGAGGLVRKLGGPVGCIRA